MAKQSISLMALTLAISGQVPAHRFVGTDNALAGAGANTMGVSQHLAEDEEATVDVLGAVPIETGGAVTAGELVESDASGRAIDKTTGVAVARALESATSAGQFVQCVLITN